MGQQVPADAGWTVVLPVKGGLAAKSRLGAIPGLAEAIAADTLDAVAACAVTARMLVVTTDRAAARVASLAGADVVAERLPGAGLLAAVGDGVAAAGAGPVAVLLADLPALRPEDLATALRAAGAALADRPMAAVPDAEGGGARCSRRRPGRRISTRRSDPDRWRSTAAAAPSSSTWHCPGCAATWTPPPSSPRRSGWAADTEPPRWPPSASASAYPDGVQATVHRFDPSTGAGSVITDTGTVLPFTPQAFASTRLRHLRPGQRLTVTVEGSGAQAWVTAMRLGNVAVVPRRTPHP